MRTVTLIGGPADGRVISVSDRSYVVHIVEHRAIKVSDFDPNVQIEPVLSKRHTYWASYKDPGKFFWQGLAE